MYGDGGGGNEDGDYGGSDGVKFQTKWLPVEGTAPHFLSHFRAAITAYLRHAYEVKLFGRIDKCTECAFIIDPVARGNCPDEFKGAVSEVVDFASDIQAKRAHNTTCNFPEAHKCEVHHLIFDPKFVSVDDIKKDHAQLTISLRERGEETSLSPKNIIVYCFSKAKAIASRTIRWPHPSSSRS